MTKPAQDERRSVFLDSSELIKALEALANPRKEWRESRIKKAGLRLAYHLMTTDEVVYDGNVRKENQDQIDELYKKIKLRLGNTNQSELIGRLVPEEYKDESALISSAIQEAVYYFQDYFFQEPLDRLQFSFGSGLSDIEGNVFKPIKEGASFDNLIEDILKKRGITGRRFYAAIYGNEVARELITEWVNRDELRLQDLNLMFTIFRSKLSESKCLDLVDGGKKRECFYDPDHKRVEIFRAMDSSQLAVQNDTVRQKIDDAMKDVLLSKNSAMTRSRDLEVPAILNLALAHNNKADFLNTVLDFKNSQMRKKYDEGVELIRGIENEQAFEEIEEDLKYYFNSTYNKTLAIPKTSVLIPIPNFKKVLNSFMRNEGLSGEFEKVVASGFDSLSGSNVVKHFFKFGTKGRRAGSKLSDFYAQIDKTISAQGNNSNNIFK